MFSGLIYISDIFRGKVRPHRVTWWILGFLNCGIATSYYASGASTTIWLPLEFGISFLLIGILSIWYGEGNWQWIDTLCLVGAVVGICLWWWTRSAPIGLIAFVAVDALGLLPTMLKAYYRPWTEESWAWFTGTLAGLLNVLAVDVWSPEIALYPIYVFVTSGVICYFVSGKRQVRQTAGGKTT